MVSLSSCIICYIVEQRHETGELVLDGRCEAASLGLYTRVWVQFVPCFAVCCSRIYVNARLRQPDTTISCHLAVFTFLVCCRLDTSYHNVFIMLDVARMCERLCDTACRYFLLQYVSLLRITYSHYTSTIYKHN